MLFAGSDLLAMAAAGRKKRRQGFGPAFSFLTGSQKPAHPPLETL
jgi:hypothetical protein